MNRKKTIQVFRQRVLGALDSAARETFNPPGYTAGSGATDADLPRLFKAIDAQVDVLAKRYNREITKAKP